MLVSFLDKHFDFLLSSQLCIILIYVGLLGITSATVAWQIRRHEASNTRVRKIFHLIMVAAIVPALMYQCTFLFVASGISLALLVLLETMRLIELWPVYELLQQTVQTFIDEKDAGIVALTPFYLLVGCLMPIFVHPCPCDLLDTAGFNLLSLLSGVISVGIGDAAASFVGSKYGNHYWPSKTNNL